MGPYDKRTIIGMRIRGALSGEQMLVDDLGRNITVAELMAQRSGAAAQSRATPSGGWPNFRVDFARPEAAALKSAAYTADGEIRLQADVIRVAGSTRGLFGTRRHGRVKLPMTSLKSAQLRGRRLELWFELPADGSERFQQGAIAFEMDNELSLADMINQLPVPVTEGGDVAPVNAEPARAASTGSGHYGAWALVASVLVIVLVVSALAISRYSR